MSNGKENDNCDWGVLPARFLTQNIDRVQTKLKKLLSIIDPAEFAIWENDHYKYNYNTDLRKTNAVKEILKVFSVRSNEFTTIEHQVEIYKAVFYLLDDRYYDINSVVIEYLKFKGMHPFDIEYRYKRCANNVLEYLKHCMNV